MELTEKKEKNSLFKKNEKITSRKNLITISEKKENKENKENIEISESKENQKHSLNMGDNFITLRTRDNHDNISVIEAKLPNPYLNINNPERNKTIQFRVNSKFKSPYADYINHSLTNDTSNYKSGFNKRKIVNSNIFNNHIHFTRTQDNKNRKNRKKL